MSLAEEIRQLRSEVKRLNKENKRLQEERDFLNEAAAFFAAAVGSKQAGANEVHCAQNLRWRRKRQNFILLQSAEIDTAVSKCIRRCSLNIRILEYQMKPRYTA